MVAFFRGFVQQLNQTRQLHTLVFSEIEDLGIRILFQIRHDSIERIGYEGVVSRR